MLKWQRNNAHFSTFGFCHSFVIGHSSFSFEIFIRVFHGSNLVAVERAGKSVEKKSKNNVDTLLRIQVKRRFT